MKFEEYTSITREQAPNYCKGSENQRVREYIKSTIGQNDVVEIGCGVGIDAHRYTPTQYLGTDISEELIRVARDNNPQHNFLCCNVVDGLPEHRKYSYAKSVLEHTPNESVFLDIVNAMLAASDVAILAFHTPPIYTETKIIQCLGHFGKTIYQNHYRRDILACLDKPIERTRIDNFEVWTINTI